jgi:hypothetical protein
MLYAAMQWNKRPFTHPGPAMYIYLYTTQENTILHVNASRLLQLSKGKSWSSFVYANLLHI